MSEEQNTEELLESIKPLYTEATKKVYRESWEEFFRTTTSDELLIVVLRSHIFIENEIENLLSKFSIKVEKTKLQFYIQKLDLLNSIGVVEKELYDSLSFVNQIRNKFAHRLDYEFNNEVYNDLYSKLPGDMRSEMAKEFSPEKLRTNGSDYLVPMRRVLGSLWAKLKEKSLDLWGREIFAIDVRTHIHQDAHIHLSQYYEDIKKSLESTEDQKEQE
ncbi:hypothetical protein QWJ34_17080 [Saccharibacillus sp. CPCC 101409]|uniref:hypothetical protein n=1 Tax=Saccharibacillus sp. CPCC 101409 TaxID=3058041 RepID=UPI002672DB15|nr:hypothetical protein [Saccharibacillus sp. CPCC 101409]MDO3411482.1 hypothetical protein [Saccharibacillus sp. CPCC 101409]